jgi:hypothetical protein
MAQEASSTSRSTFATAGRIKLFLRGRISSTVPFPFCREMVTKSPTIGVMFSRRKRPRARHSTSPPSVST